MNRSWKEITELLRKGQETREKLRKVLRESGDIPDLSIKGQNSPSKAIKSSGRGRST